MTSPAQPTGQQPESDASLQMRARAMAALRRGEFDLAEEAINRGDATLAELIENLRTYQIELQMQSEELQRSHARTQQALDQFMLLFARLPVPALLMDANGVIVESNHRAEETFGLSAAMMRGYLFHRMVDADDYQAEVRGALLDARGGNQAEVAAVRFRARSDQQLVGDLHVESIVDAISGSQQFVCVIVDRTEQMANLEKLQATVARLRAREDEPASQVALTRLVADASGQVAWCDPELGVAAGSRLVDLAARLRPDEARTLIAALADGSAVDIMLTDGSGTACPLALAPVRDGGGNLAQWLALTRR